MFAAAMGLLCATISSKVRFLISFWIHSKGQLSPFWVNSTPPKYLITRQGLPISEKLVPSVTSPVLEVQPPRFAHCEYFRFRLLLDRVSEPEAVACDKSI